MRICLIGYYDERQYGLRCLEATLVEDDHQVVIIVIKSYGNMFVPPTEVEYGLLLEKVREIKPDIIGITVRSQFVWLAKDMTQLLRELNVPIIWGGFHVTVAPEYSIKRPDMILRGEADLTFPMLLKTMSEGGDLSAVPGLWWKENGEIKKNPLGPPLHDVNSLPLPVYSKENKWFIENDTLYPGEVLYYKDLFEYETMASRGCPQECTYCANSALIALYGPEMKSIRSRDPELIVEEVKRFSEQIQKPRGVAFVDEVFSFNLKWVEKFCDVWVREMNLPIALQVYPVLLSEEIVKKLKDAGLHYVNMGLQSGSPETRNKLYKRHMSNEKILETANRLHRNNIAYRVDIILDNPLEPAEDVKQTLDLLLEFPRPFMYSLYSLVHFPGTELTKLFLEKGLITIEEVHGATENFLPSWDTKLEITDKFDSAYYFYKHLIIISNFRYHFEDPSWCPPKPHFYPRWFVRWLERRMWLKNNSKAMLSLTDKLGKFAHWSYYWTSYFPARLGFQIKTAFRLAAKGDWQGIKTGLRNFGGRAARQLGFKSAD